MGVTCCLRTSREPESPSRTSKSPSCTFHLPRTTMSWQSYVDDQLISTNMIKNAVIAGHDGNIWASSAGTTGSSYTHTIRACTVLMQWTPDWPFLARTTRSLAARNMYFVPPTVTPFIASWSVLEYLSRITFSSAAVTLKPALDAQMLPSCPAITAFLIMFVEINWSST